MSLASVRQRRIVLGMLSLLLLPRPAHGQDLASIFTNLSKFVSGFDAGVVFVAPTGFISSDVLDERGGLQQVGIALRNPTLGISVGYDLLTGLQAKEESLELRGSVAAMPTITQYFDTPLPKIGKVVPNTGVGLSIGLSQLQDARATLPQSTGAGHVVKLDGTGYHFGASFSFGLSVRNVGVYVENSYRYTRFPSLNWTDEKSIVPPVGWPSSMDFWTGTLRIGVGIGAP